MYSKLFLFLFAVGLPAVGCNGNGSSSDSGPPDGPPRICNTPPALTAGPYFKDVTKAWGLDQDGLAIEGIRLATADLDEDSLPDLVVHKVGNNNRDDLGATPPKRYRHLLLNEKGAAFRDHTDGSGLFAIRGGGLGRSSHFAIFADVNNDGHLDAFTGTYVNADSSAAPDPGDRNELLLGDGKGGFKLAPQSGLSHKEKYSTTSAAFLDYDRDGNIDLFVGFFYEIYGYLPANQDRLYRGNGDGTFTDVTDQLGLTTQRNAGFAEGTNSRPTYGVTACDVDGDGDTDLLVSAYGRQWNMLWRNDGSKFTNVAPQSGFDADGLVDYKDNEFYKCYCQSSGSCTAAPPKLSCTVGSWTAGSDDQPWRLGGNTFSTVCGDFDNDGDMDLYNAEIQHWHIGLSSDPSQMLVNSGKSPLSFQRPGTQAMGLDREHKTTDWNEGDISAALFDFDADGLQDVIVMGSDYPDTRTLLYHQKADHTFEELAVIAGIDHKRGQELSVADLDGDGDLDVLLGTSTMRPDATGPFEAQVHLYENLVGSKSNWLKVRLVGSGKGGANHAAVGAWVKVTAGGTTQLREVGGGHGHFGLQHDLVLHFGLGSSCEVEQLEVIWPDKQNSRSTFQGVNANYLIEIEQQSGALRYVTGQ